MWWSWWWCRPRWSSRGGAAGGGFGGGRRIEVLLFGVFCSPEIMGSSEIVDSGSFPGQKSNFVQTCSLLSQYLIEKGSFGDLSLGVTRNFETIGAPAKTMNFLPMIEKTGKTSEEPAGRTLNMPVNLFPYQAGFGPAFPKEEAQKTTDISVMKSEPEKAQMTIFYGGQVIVFNDFPADKAKEIMLLASKGNSPDAVNTFTTSNIVPIPKPAESATNLVSSTPCIAPSFRNNRVQESAPRPLQPIVNDLPIARKASLARFLEKRKDRFTYCKKSFTHKILGEAQR